MVMRSLEHMITPHKRLNSVNNPHKRNPEKYLGIEKTMASN